MDGPGGGRTAWSSSRVAAVAVCLSLLAALLAGGSAKMLAAQYLCPPQWWAEQVADQVAELVPPRAVETDVYVADCDDHRGVEVDFRDTGRSATEEFGVVLQRAAERGWDQADGEPWWGCWTKRIYGIRAWMRVLADRAAAGGGPDGYGVSAINSPGGSCNGGRWANENPENM